MNFSEFAQRLYKIINAGEDIPTFTSELFESITVFKKEENNIVDNTSASSFKKYYTGEREIKKFANEIRKYMEPAKFDEYITKLSEEIQLQIFEEFAKVCPEMTKMNVSEKMAELFKSIIIEATNKKRRTPKKKQTLKGENIVELKTSDYALLLECNSRCSLCGQKLIVSKNGKEYSLFKPLDIIPLGTDTATINKLEKLSNIKAPEYLHSSENNLAVCFNCFEKYNNERTVDECSFLIKKKLELLKREEIVDTSDEIDIEKGISQIIQSFSNLKQMPTKLIKDDFNAYLVEEKIPNDLMLQDHVTELVLKYYPFIKSEFGEQERLGILKFNKIKNEVSQCFQNLDEMNLSQQIIFDSMVEWIYKQSDSKNKIACEAVIAFFVQNCEVFEANNEVSK